jgi:hypothetical protein
VAKTLANFDQELADLRNALFQNSSFVFLLSDLPNADLLHRSKGVRNCRSPIQGETRSELHGDNVTYTSTKRGIFCDSFALPEFDNNQQYLIHIQGKTLSGAGAQLLVLNGETKRFDLTTATGTSDFNLWEPIYPSHNSSYTGQYAQFVLNGESYADEQNRVEFENLTLYPFPLNWLAGIYIQNSTPISQFQTEIQTQHKVGTTFYQAQVNAISDPSLIGLPQSFDTGWIAFKQPKKFGEWLSLRKNFFPHIQYNGWANAWLLPKGEYTVAIWYWPQLLSFVGYGILALTIMLLAIKGFWSWRHSKIR